MPYSVSPRRTLKIVGLNPSWNLRTRMPTRLAARKCPSSCTKTSTPSTNANDRMVMINRRPSDLQFYRARYLERTLARPTIDCTDLLECRHLGRRMRIHRALDHLRNCGEPDFSLEEPRDRHLVCRIQHDRQTAFGLERAIGEPQTRKR